MKYAIKLKLTPSSEQARILDGQSKICNWAYNHLLEYANNLKKEFKQDSEENKDRIAKIIYTKRGLRDLLPDLKKEKKFLNSVYNKPLKNAILRLSRAIGDHQKSIKGKRKGKIVGWPKFAKWKEKWFSLLYCEPWVGYDISDGQLNLSLGTDENNNRMKLTVPIEDTCRLRGKSVKTLEIVKEYNNYYGSFVVEQPEPEKKVVDKVVAIDPNHRNIGYAVANDGHAFEITNVKKLVNNHAKKIEYLQSRRSLCKKKSKEIVLENGKVIYLPSRRWSHFDKALNKAYAKRQEQIKHLLYALANTLYKRYDLVAIGDYTPPSGIGISRGMRKSMNNQSLIGKLKLTLEHVALKSGKHFEEYNENKTTRNCHVCNISNQSLTVNDKTWTCDICNTTHHRDENAAINGLRKKINMPRSGLFEIKQRWTWQWKFSKWMSLAKELNDEGGTSSAKHRFI